MLYDVTIPPNTTADLILPVPTQTVRQSGQPLPAQSTASTQVLLRAGMYHFSFPRELVK
jgi:hypothetical protein